MLLKDKLILVFYLGCEGMNRRQVNETSVQASMYFRYLRDESSETIFIPNFESPNTKVEVLNPRDMNTDDLKKLESLIDEFNKTCKKDENNN